MKNKRLAVIDSSPLLCLTHLNLCREINLFFDRVYVPRAVQKEVNRKHRFRYRLKKLYETGFFVRCFAADATNVKLLRPDVDEGEAEALIQAQENNAAYFIGDDKRAREIAHSLSLGCVGTVRLLARLELEGRAGPARALVAKLENYLGFRVTDEVVEESIAMASEPI